MKNNIKNRIPTVEEAELILKRAEEINPGFWIGHARNVAESARLIAENCEGLDPEVAYVLGLLHDIGNTLSGSTIIGHIMDGYNYAMDNGYDLLAKICVTHSCPNHSILDIFDEDEKSNVDGYKFIEEFLNNNRYDDYDKLIQLCDALGLHNGFTLIEKRLIDVAIRNGVNEYTIPKWKAFMNLKDYFTEKVGKSIYTLLPGVVENTFEF